MSSTTPAQEALALAAPVLQSLAFGDNEQTLKVIADGFRLEVHRDTISMAGGPFLNEFTARHSSALENVDVSAIVGWPVLQPFAFGLDFEAGQLTLNPAADASAQEASQNFATVIEGVRIVDNQVHVPVSYDSGTSASMTFGTAGYHTYLNQEIAERLGKPAGERPGHHLWRTARSWPVRNGGAVPAGRSKRCQRASTRTGCCAPASACGPPTAWKSTRPRAISP